MESPGRKSSIAEAIERLYFRTQLKRGEKGVVNPQVIDRLLLLVKNRVFAQEIGPKRLEKGEILKAREALQFKIPSWDENLINLYRNVITHSFRLKRGDVTLQDILDVLTYFPLGTPLYFDDIACLLTKDARNIPDLCRPLGQAITSRLQAAKTVFHDFEKTKPFRFSFLKGYLAVTLDLQQ